MVDPLSDGRAEPTAEARALLVLDQLSGVGPATLRRIVQHFGSAEAALTAPNRTFLGLAGAQAARDRRDPEIVRSVDRALERAVQLGIDVMTWDSEAYPERLRHLPDPPPVLFLRGRGELLERRTVTVVGSRRATGRARDLAGRLGRALAEAQVVVASGLALGVDGAAHRGALEAGGDTIAVLGTGPDEGYPRTHVRLFRAILSRGLVVSEFLPGTPALPHNFPRRNRILAALAGSTVVVEAGARSGALITVDHALDLGRDVWVVPGPIEQAATAGSNRLLSEGARPLVSLSDFVRAVAPEATVRQLEVALASGPEGRALLALAEGALSIEELALRLEIEVGEALALVTVLELRGAVVRLPGMRFRPAA